MPKKSKKPALPEVAFAVRAESGMNWHLVQLTRQDDGSYKETKLLNEDLPVIVAGKVKQLIAMELLR